VLESYSAKLAEPTRFRYALAEYHPEAALDRRIVIGVLVQGRDELLFRFLSPNEATDLIPQLSRDVVFNIERTFNKDREEGTVPIPDRETGSRTSVSVTSSEYLEYLHSTFLNTITFTEPREIVASDARSLRDSIFRSHVLEPIQQATANEPLVTESLTDGLILLLHARNNEPVAGSTKLQKLTFLLKEETKLGQKLKDEFEYVPHDFGPYSSDLESMLEVLQEEGLVQIEEKPLSDANAESDRQQIRKSEQEIGAVEKKKIMRVYKLTQEGQTLAEALARSLSPSEMQEVSELKGKFNPCTTREIIDYVYRRYEKMTTKSKLRKHSH
jgi:uncharacterized protein YwgA